MRAGPNNTIKYHRIPTRHLLMGDINCWIPFIPSVIPTTMIAAAAGPKTVKKVKMPGQFGFIAAGAPKIQDKPYAKLKNIINGYCFTNFLTKMNIPSIHSSRGCGSAIADFDKTRYNNQSD